MIGIWAAVAHAGVVVHEWGTFTAVAGPDGLPVLWHPLDGSSDLPDFVYGPEREQEGVRLSDLGGKGQPAILRMETPVIYFYTDKPVTMDVSVHFPEGQLTEWYPRVRSYDVSGLDWGPVKLLPGKAGKLPHDGSESHYYPAREVPSATVQVCDPRGTEQERFLFYRGIGQFPLSLAATAQETYVKLWTTEGALGQVLLFERQGDRVGYTKTASTGFASRPALDDTLEGVYRELESMLVAEGLYAPEAHAMVETWKGDWFEDGLRVLYLVPRAETDARLPLSLNPAPDELVRVMVGRLEVRTPEQRFELIRILGQLSSDASALAQLQARFGRFAEPWLSTSDHPRASALLSLQ